MTKRDVPEDRPARVDVEGPELLANGFRRYERYHLVLHHDDGARDVQTRDIVRVGAVVGVLGYDPERELVVLIRQFRLSTHLSRDRGALVEIVAGIVEDGESYESTALRECEEEAGVRPRQLVPMVQVATSPGVSDEYAVFFLAIVDAGALPERAGLAEEAETIHPFAVTLDEALAAVNAGRVVNGYVVIALQWLALNLKRLPQLLAASTEKA
ncbi:NUDIX hydrolase [Xanthobacter autotrophicus DSM 431]|uniref:NUDIX domain-containing protein n=1 Tax=Xanthobacter nonsaccharivorans TaxID=3119912 RepID=UPI003727D117